MCRLMTCINENEIRVLHLRKQKKEKFIFGLDKIYTKQLRDDICSTILLYKKYYEKKNFNAVSEYTTRAHSIFSKKLIYFSSLSLNVFG